MPKSFGNLFHVKNKSKDNLPDARGNMKITSEFIDWLNNAPRDADGNVEVDIAGWNKVGPKAGKYLNVSISEPFNNTGSGYSGNTARPSQPKADDDFEDSEIPF